MSNTNVLSKHAEAKRRSRIMFWQVFLSMLSQMMATLAFCIAIVPSLTANLPLGAKPSIVFVIFGSMCTLLAGIFMRMFIDFMNDPN